MLQHRGGEVALALSQGGEPLELQELSLSCQGAQERVGGHTGGGDGGGQGHRGHDTAGNGGGSQAADSRRHLVHLSLVRTLWRLSVFT